MPTNYESIRNDIKRKDEILDKAHELLGNMYTDKTHFIFELLQNAEDAGATKILFILLEDRLEVKHNGRPFNSNDVVGVCSIGKGTKADDLTKIGKFGVGFKSVYAYTKTPEIYSGDESFIIEKFIEPCPLPSLQIGNSWTTLFIFPFNKKDTSPETACKEIGQRLINLSARTLLFLRNINEIEYRLPDSKSGFYLRDEVARDTARQVRVIGQKGKEEEEEESWLIFERPLLVPENAEYVRVEIGFYLDKVDKDEKESIKKVNDSPLIAFFPTHVKTNLGFLIQGPYRTTPARNDIPKDDDWNKKIIDETAKLVIEVLPLIKQMGLLTVSFLETLPINSDDFSQFSMFYPIFEAVRETLSKADLLPTNDGTFVSAQNAKMGSKDLRDLLNHEKLNEFYQSNETIDWLSKEITKDRTKNLHPYLIKELGVAEITPEMFAEELTERFLSSQTDDWLISMYRYVSLSKTIWQPRKYIKYFINNPEGPLRSKPIIRLQNDTHVQPFRYDGSPNAYLEDAFNLESSLPIVKKEISQNEEAFKFLKELGIPELDLVTVVIEKILSKYTSNPSAISKEEHEQDISTILKAFNTTDSEKKKTQLIEELRNTPFIRTHKQVDNVTLYKKPEELYFESEKLRQYFSSNETVSFVHSGYEETTKNLFKVLGIVKSVRVVRSIPDNQGYVSIKKPANFRKGDFHQRGLDGYDPNINIDGLDFAIESITSEKSQYIWEFLAVPNWKCIRGVIEKSKLQTFGKIDDREDHTSKFGKLLIDSKWLPGPNNSFVKPCEMNLNDLPDSFVRNKDLGRQLEMKHDDVEKLAEKAGVYSEDILFVRENPKEFQKWKAGMIAKKNQPEFPSRTVNNPERRQEQVSNQISEATEKKYENRERSVRVSKGKIGPSLWLRNQYTNDSSQMVCQICKKEMPFKKRDGEYYFESVEVLSNEYLNKEHEAQYLALCPLCAAMFEEFVKNDENALNNLKSKIVNLENCEIQLILGDISTSIQFVETHFHDLKIILNESELS